jgi:hypothetical protein
MNINPYSPFKISENFFCPPIVFNDNVFFCAFEINNDATINTIVKITFFLVFSF